MGLLPDGDTETTARMNLDNDGLSLNEALRTRQFWTICASNFAVVCCLMTVMLHIVPFAREIKVSATAAAGVLSAIGGVSMAGRFVGGLAIDRIGSKKVMVFTYILLLAGLLWLQIAAELWMLYLFALIYGLAHGGFFTTFSPIVAEFFGIKSHGAIFGIAMFCGTFGGAIGPVMAGYVFDISGGYSGAVWICTLVGALGFVLISSLKPVMGGAKADG